LGAADSPTFPAVVLISQKRDALVVAAALPLPAFLATFAAVVGADWNAAVAAVELPSWTRAVGNFGASAAAANKAICAFIEAFSTVLSAA
jgi:hypothetical protein